MTAAAHPAPRHLPQANLCTALNTSSARLASTRRLPPLKVLVTSSVGQFWRPG